MTAPSPLLLLIAAALPQEPPQEPRRSLLDIRVYPSAHVRLAEEMRAAAAPLIRGTWRMQRSVLSDTPAAALLRSADAIKRILESGEAHLDARARQAARQWESNLRSGASAREAEQDAAEQRPGSPYETLETFVYDDSRHTYWESKVSGGWESGGAGAGSFRVLRGGRRMFLRNVFRGTADEFEVRWADEEDATWDQFPTKAWAVLIERQAFARTYGSQEAPGLWVYKTEDRSPIPKERLLRVTMPPWYQFTVAAIVVREKSLGDGLAETSVSMQDFAGRVVEESTIRWSAGRPARVVHRIFLPFTTDLYHAEEINVVSFDPEARLPTYRDLASQPFPAETITDRRFYNARRKVGPEPPGDTSPFDRAEVENEKKKKARSREPEQPEGSSQKAMRTLPGVPGRFDSGERKGLIRSSPWWAGVRERPALLATSYMDTWLPADMFPPGLLGGGRRGAKQVGFRPPTIVPDQVVWANRRGGSLEFYFLNHNPAPMRIAHIAASCGCMTALSGGSLEVPPFGSKRINLRLQPERSSKRDHVSIEWSAPTGQRGTETAVIVRT